MISVIIPNYNNEKYIAACLDSILGQSLLPDEIIVVDDCSTDGSTGIIKEYSSQYEIIHPIFLDKNGGVSNARNVGLDYATQKYVTFIDADDIYYNPDKLKNEMELIAYWNKRGKKILSYSVTHLIDESGESLEKYGFFDGDLIEGDARLELLLMSKMNRVPRDYLIEKSAIIDCGAYNFYKNYYEDLDLLFRIANNGYEFYCTKEWGTGYRLKSSGGLSHRSAKESEETKREIRDMYFRRMPVKIQSLYYMKKIKWLLQRRMR